MLINTLIHIVNFIQMHAAVYTYAHEILGGFNGELVEDARLRIQFLVQYTYA